MGQRLDRPSSSSPNGNNNTHVNSNSPTNTTLTSSNHTSDISSSSSSQSTRRSTLRSGQNHTNRNANLSSSPSLSSLAAPNYSNTSSSRNLAHNARSSSRSNDSSSTINSHDVANMSPRTRLRHELRHHNNNDLLFRFFQFPSSNAENNNTGTTSSNLTSQQQQSSLSRLFSNYNHRNPNHQLFVDENESDLSSDDDEHGWSQMNSIARSLPFFFGMRDFKCFVCNKLIPADDVETHIMMCLTKPRITYNEDVLTEDKGECIICFEILEKGQTIARLACLCIYHKHCIDCWLKRSQCCPGHPD